MNIPKIWGGSQENLQKFAEPTPELLDSVTNRYTDGPTGSILWAIGNFSTHVKPIRAALGDEMGLLAMLIVFALLGLPAVLVPFWADERHNGNMRAVKWYAALKMAGVKAPTAGAIKVFCKKILKLIVPPSQSGNRAFRTDTGVSVNDRRQNGITVVGCMPMGVYAEVKKWFYFVAGSVQTIVRTDAWRMAYALQYFLKDLSRNPRRAVVALKPTQGLEDAVFTALIQRVVELYGVRTASSFQEQENYYHDFKLAPIGWFGKVVNFLFQRERSIAKAVDAVLGKLPEGFWTDGMQFDAFELEFVLSDIAYPDLFDAVVDQVPTSYLCGDGERDRLTDLNPALIGGFVRLLGKVKTLLIQKAESELSGEKQGAVLAFLNAIDPKEVLTALGFETKVSKFEQLSIMYTPSGAIYETVIGSAPDKFGTKGEGGLIKGGNPTYDLRAFFSMVFAAYAEQGDEQLNAYLAEVRTVVWATYDENPNLGILDMLVLLEQRIRKPDWLLSA